MYSFASMRLGTLHCIDKGSVSVQDEEHTAAVGDQAAQDRIARRKREPGSHGRRSEIAVQEDRTGLEVCALMIATSRACQGRGA